jgi:hypothetical protein
VGVPEEFSRHPKFRQHDLDRWMTYADAFDYANKNLADEICCLLNLDIFLDPGGKWDHMPEILQKKIIFCLSRLEFSTDGKWWTDPHMVQWGMAVSQDAWVFRAPVTVEDCDFGVGTLGCDNAVAHRIKKSDYLPINASMQYRIFHLDRVRNKTMGNHDKVYLQERSGVGRGESPERKGQFLVPDIDTVKSVDAIMDMLKVKELDRYMIVCEVLNRLVTMKNDV